MKYEEAVAYILNIPKFTTKNDLQHTRDLLARLGDPQADMKIIHVAGTNGKGSVCAYIAEILKADGRSVGLFTSPHLIQMNERFRINGSSVSDEAFMTAFASVYDVVMEQREQGIAHPTFFEFLFLMAMVLFRRQQAAYVLLETGMGGRLDATNAIAAPALTVITSIGLDHTEILGDTITAIAAEKAGIMKPGVPLVCDGRRQEVGAVVSKRARELHVPVTFLKEEDYKICEKKEEHIVFSVKNRYSKYEITGSADYQAANAALAVLAAEQLQEPVSVSQIRSGLSQAYWPGRMEQVRPGVYLDGAHNLDGIGELNRRIREERRPVTILFACTKEKDPARMVRQLCDGTKLAGVVLTETAGARGRDPQELYPEFKSYVSGPVIIERDNRRSLEQALQIKEEQGVLFVAGSLYLIGSIKEHMEVL